MPDFFTPIRKKYGKHHKVPFSFQHGFLYAGSKVYMWAVNINKNVPIKYFLLDVFNDLFIYLFYFYLFLFIFYFLFYFFTFCSFIFYL